jgi:hypothetical protein
MDIRHFFNRPAPKVFYTDEKLEQMFREIVENDIYDWCKKHTYYPEQKTEDEYQNACVEYWNGERYNTQDEIDEHWTKKEQAAFIKYFKQQLCLGKNEEWEVTQYFTDYYELTLNECVECIDAEEWVEEDPYYQYDILDCPDMKRLTIQVAMDKEYEQITKDLKKGKITPQESLIRRKAITAKQKAYLEKERKSEQKEWDLKNDVVGGQDRNGIY